MMNKRSSMMYLDVILLLEPFNVTLMHLGMIFSFLFIVNLWRVHGKVNMEHQNPSPDSKDRFFRVTGFRI